MFASDFNRQSSIDFAGARERLGRMAQDVYAGLRGPRTTGLMIDIETGGLSRSAPLLQLGMEYTGLDTGKELNVFPMRLTRNDSKLDPSANYKYSISHIKDIAEFESEFGTWAFKKKFNLETLYAGLEKLPEDKLARLRGDALIKNSLDMASYGLEGLGTLTTPRGATKALIEELKQLKAKDQSLIAANMPFESARLGGLLDFYLDPENPNNLIDEVALDRQGLRNLFEATYEFKGSTNILDPANVGFKQNLRSMEVSQGNLRNIALLSDSYYAKGASGIRNIDIQDMSRMLFSGFNILTGSPSADVYTGTSVDFATQLLFGEAEEHYALADVRHQKRILEQIEGPTRRLAQVAAGMQPGATIKQQAIGMASGLLNLVDSKFAKTYAYAASRQAVGKYKDDMLKVAYAGTVSNMYKHRSMHRSLSIMHNSIDAWIAHAEGRPSTSAISMEFGTTPDGRTITTKGEPFTVTGKGTKRIDYVTSAGAKVTEFRNWATDQNLVNDSIELYKRVNAEKGADAARQAVTSDVLDKFYGSRFFTGSDMGQVFSREQVQAEYERLAPMLGDTDVYKMLTEGDKKFKKAVINVAKTADSGIGDYVRFFAGAYKRQLAVAAVGTAILGKVGLSSLSQVTRGQGDKLDSEAGLDLSKASRMDPAKVAQQDPGAFMSLMRSDPEFRKRQQEDLDRRNKEYQKKLGVLRPGDLKGLSSDILKSSSLGSSVPMKEVDLSKFRVEVEDADTLTLHRLGRKSISIRMAGIDAPEVSHKGESYAAYKKPGSMPYGEEATQRLKELVSQGDLSLVIQDGEQTYGRYIGAVFSGKQNLNLQLVQEGMVAALPYGSQSESLESQKAFGIAEKYAFNSGSGMWSQPYYKEFYYSDRATFNSLVSYDRIAMNRRYANLAMDMESAGIDMSQRNAERKESMALAQNAALFDMMSGNPGRDPRRRS